MPAAREEEDSPSILPIRRYANAIVQAVKDNPTVVVIGETGSGKTTQISQVRGCCSLPACNTLKSLERARNSTLVVYTKLSACVCLCVHSFAHRANGYRAVLLDLCLRASLFVFVCWCLCFCLLCSCMHPHLQPWPCVGCGACRSWMRRAMPGTGRLPSPSHEEWCVFWCCMCMCRAESTGAYSIQHTTCKHEADQGPAACANAAPHVCGRQQAYKAHWSALLMLSLSECEGQAPGCATDALPVSAWQVQPSSRCIDTCANCCAPSGDVRRTFQGDCDCNRCLPSVCGRWL